VILRGGPGGTAAVEDDGGGPGGTAVEDNGGGSGGTAVEETAVEGRSLLTVLGVAGDGGPKKKFTVNNVL
jgi:hypothetical protein